ncbi:hypothetical protein WJX81_000055 [Elliptochloris bilobata]|uniref:Uncharacterized protein n=1 Tax=Elliptochloris bilobata TaxID=381761 RepID=A0AAW1RFM2_9CHLO
MDAVHYVVWRLCILLRRTRAALARLLDWLLQEFEPWFKWMVFDAVLYLVANAAVKRLSRLRPAFEAVGWI